MGFEDREYSQDGSWQTSWGSDTPTTKRLLITTILVFLAQSLLTHDPTNALSVVKFQTTRISYLDEWFMLDVDAVKSGQVWRVASYIFVHDRQNPVGLLFNCLLLWFLGSRLERMYGSREFLLYYLGAGIASGILFAGIGMSTPLVGPLCGAAPCVMALFTLYAMHFPGEEILLFWLIPVQIFVLLLIYVGLDIYTVVQALNAEAPWEIAAVASSHLCGAGFAVLYKRMNWHLSPLVNFSIDWRAAWRRRMTSRRLKVYQPVVEKEDIDAKVDAILAKIHEHGTESLTAAEQALLARASERYKKKV